MKIKEKRTLSPDTLRSVCIIHNWYTHGTNEEYNNLFSKLYTDRGSRAHITTEKLVEIAEDIMKHSEVDSDYEITSVMFELNLNCDVTFEVG